MIKALKQKKCRQCSELFQPGNSLTVVCSPSCAQAYGKKTEKVKKEKSKPKPKKPKTAAQLKKDLWVYFSLHQKLVHSVDGENCECYTCGKPLKIGSADNHGGHCHSKAANPNLYFDERSVRPQCLRCNVHHGGMHYEFNERLKQEIGMEAWQDMYDNRKLVVKKNADWYLEKIVYYKEQCKIIKDLKSNI